ncbi:hypothetical protein BU14_0027s0135 [Porphyra umbilicalis]|uniref:Uncharacterized protein n=1 Tax=Porphyra umbilicalis TaxID=2786 RepID=A0A1X6PKC3_PORUM|nr:hypothetical protein BU14_0027s0135 [Porphyra umbilicalis]|eukprot:OSX81113.1 hypothetical protein BU14_0027s0135 [Porphyra umbilicalis]
MCLCAATLQHCAIRLRRCAIPSAARLKSSPRLC